MIELKYINFLEYSNEYLNVDFHIHDCYEFVYYHKGTGQILTKNKLDASKKDGGFFLKSKLLKDRDIVKESIMYLPTLSACQKNDTVIETFSPNTYCIYEPFVPHAEKHASAPVITTIGFTITDEPAPHPAKYNDVFGEVESMLKKIKDEYFDNKSLFLEAISHYFSIILLLAKRSVNDNLPQNFPSLEYAKNYIDQYFTTEINFNQLASTSGYCLDHFRVLFKNKFGLSLKQYVLNNQIEFAKKQLVNTDLTINEITFNCGYNSYKQFAQIFKKHTGYSFSEYRALHQAKNATFPPIEK